ncbi:MAG: hypothetical protein Q7T55_21770 [Solirubrobacteraceae bacterium]|nr:hypothetical protein [Solirubrobacteraceae bacterium]
MPRTRKLLLTTLVVGATSAVAGLGVFAAFTAQTTNTGNQIASGTVAIGQNSGGVAIYNVTNGGPGQTTQRCIRVTYTGTLPATVKLFRSNTVTQGTAFNLQVERGSGLNPTTNPYPSCTGFTPDSPGGSLYNGTLIGFPTSYLAGPDAKGAAWAQGDTVDYRFTITVIDDPTPNTHDTVIQSGSHAFTWEARNN